MSDIQLDVKDFESKVDDYESGNETIAGLNCSLKKGELDLDSIDRLKQCATQFNEAMKQLNALMECDVTAMRAIKGKWMGLDSDIANKTLGDIIVETITGK